MVSLFLFKGNIIEEPGKTTRKIGKYPFLFFKTHIMRFEKHLNAVILYRMKNKLTAKLFTITDVLLRSGRPMSAVELSRETGIERNACWRIVSDLCELGYLRKASYRTVEPALGMVHWGQAAYSGTFFPRKALQELTTAAQKMNVSTALAGIFNGQLIYLHRDHCNESDFYGYPLHASNLALVILARMYGGEKALQMLVDDARKHGFSDKELSLLCADCTNRIRSTEKNGYAIDTGPNGSNISFPVERGRDVYGLAFFSLTEPHELPELIARCSVLRRKLEE